MSFMNGTLLWLFVLLSSTENVMQITRVLNAKGMIIELSNSPHILELFKQC
jgi:hypothetical protein